MNLKTIKFAKEAQTVWVTLNRAENLNALNSLMLQELSAAVEMIRKDDSSKCLVITGAGEKAFCIGSDIGFLSEAFKSRNFNLFRNYLEELNNLIFALEKLPVPVVAMVQGMVRAAGFEIMLGCDYVIVADEIKLGDVHTPFGHITGGVCQRLARKTGVQKAMELIMSGRWLNGKEAVDYGIAMHSVPKKELKEFTLKFISNFTGKHRECLHYIKKNIVGGFHLPLEDAVQFEIHNYIEFLATSNVPTDTFFKNQKERMRKKVIAN